MRKIIYTTDKKEYLYEEKGNRADGDKRFYIGKDDFAWPHTLELIGVALRAKAWVEDNNYPNGLGRYYLFAYITECILTDTPIKQLLKKFKINDS